MTNPYRQPEKAHWFLLTFTWGDPADPNVRMVTDYTQAQDSDLFQSVSTLELSIPPNTLGFDVDPAVIYLPLEVEPAVALTSGEPHAPVFVQIEQVAKAPGVAAIDRRTLFFGWVAKSSKSPAGKVGMAKLECVDLKARVAVPMGIPATNQCAFTFGGRGCDIDLDTKREKTVPIVATVEVTAIDGKKVTISDLQHTGELRYYHRGYVEVDGLRLGIREYVTGSTMELVAAPPAAWLDQPCIVTPGCSKLLTVCRDRWQNESRFLGLGIEMAPVHPLVEAES